MDREEMLNQNNIRTESGPSWDGVPTVKFLSTIEGEEFSMVVPTNIDGQLGDRGFRFGVSAIIGDRKRALEKKRNDWIDRKMAEESDRSI